MNRITFPLRFRTTGPQVANLCKAFEVLGFHVAAAERENQFFGGATVKTVRDFQKSVSLPQSGAVDKRTADALNLILEERGLLGEEPLYKVSGKVINRFGEAIPGKTIHVYDVDLRGAGIYKQVETLDQIRTADGFEPLGVTESDAKGAYEIRFDEESFQRSERHLADVIAYAVKGETVIGASCLATKKDYTDGIEIRNLDITLKESAERGISEYQALLEEIKPLLVSSKLEPHQLNVSQVRFLAEETEQPIEKIFLLAQADRLRKEYPNADLSLELLYGLGRQKIALAWIALSTRSEKALLSAIRRSINQNIISSHKQEVAHEFVRRIAEIASRHSIEEVTEGDDAGLGKALKVALGDAKRGTSFLRLYQNYEGTPKSFWNEFLPRQPEFKDNPGLIRSLKLTNQLSLLSGNHLPLMEELQLNRKINDVKDLLKLKNEDWLEIVNRAGVPEGTSGATREEKQNSYIEGMRSLLHAAYPTKTIHAMINDKTISFKDADVATGISAFLDRAADFDIASSKIEAHEALLREAAPTKFEEVKAQLRVLQRLYQVSPSPQALAKLIEFGFSSAYQIASIPERAFLAAHSEALGSEASARAVYDRSTYQVTRLQNISLYMREMTTEAMPDYTTYYPERERVREAIGKHIPNWEELFGRVDICECKHCRSVYSPAAYFVDLLRFLEGSRNEDMTKSALAVLRSRRPDLEHLLLTCENTNTIIPYIDLVNEIMEYYVANGGLDDNAGHDTGDATAEELRANPQFTKREAYSKLKEAIYPFNLPYHQPLDIIRTYLSHLRTSRAEVMGAFRTDLSARAARAIQAEELNLSEEEYISITGKNFNEATDSREAWDYFGFDTLNELRNEAVEAPEFLGRTGIAYTDLVELLKTRLINPHQTAFEYIENLFADSNIPPETLYQKLKRINAGSMNPQFDPAIKNVLDDQGISPQEFSSWVNKNFEGMQRVITLYQPESRCDLETTVLRSIQNIYEPSQGYIPTDTFSTIHRFIRLWRKTGWSMRELDNLITALGETDITPTLVEKLVFVRKINAVLKLPLNGLACFWGSIDANGDGSLYARLFLNRAVQEIDVVFRRDRLGRYLHNPDELLKVKDHVPAVLGALNLSAEHLGVIAQDNQLDLQTAPLSTETLSIIYRAAVLARALKLTIPEFCALRSLFNGQPFSRWDATNRRYEEIRPDKTLEFIETVEKVRASEFKVPALNYILTGAIDPAAQLPLNNEKIHQAMKEIREGLLRIEQEHPEQETVTEELIAKKLSLIFNPYVAAQFIAMMKDGIIYSTTAESRLRLTIPEDLSKKITYVRDSGQLSCRGILSDGEKAKLEALEGATAGFREALGRIYEKPEQFLKDHFSGLYPDTASLEEACRVLLDHPAQREPLNPGGKLTAFYRAFLPFLKKELRCGTVVLSIAQAIGLDEPMTELVIRSQIGDMIDALLPDRQSPSDRFSNSWEAWVCPPSTGEYIFIANVARADESISVSLDDRILFKKRAGDPLLSREGATKLTAGAMSRLKVSYGASPGIPGAVLSWQTDRIPKEVIPTDALYPADKSETFSELLTRHHRAALFINGFRLGRSELSHFLAYAGNFDDLDLTAITPSHWKRIWDYTNLRSEVLQRAASLVQVFDTANKSDSETNVAEIQGLLALATGWQPDHIDQLTQGFALGAADFRNEISLLKLSRAMRLIRQTGISADSMFKWASSTKDFEQLESIAQSIKNAVKAKYEDDAWFEVARGLSDRIRENQKQALIGYLLQQRKLQKRGVRDAEGLFECFLIDVQMGACMDTSRVKQAISSVQLFVTRCLLNLESNRTSGGQEAGVAPDAVDKTRWEWMKNYRVWEANRKVFLYPENWLEPELRDDKSPFFKELESELLQSDITDQAVENAFRGYLTKLGEVSNLNVCGMYQDDITKTLHVFARTHEPPYQYFYRTYDKFGDWSAWEKVQLDIRGIDDGEDSGVHLIPVVWKSRLFLFWPEFMQKQIETETAGYTAEEMAGEQPLQRPAEYWEIKLAWSEYQDGKWAPKQLSTESIITASLEPEEEVQHLDFSEPKRFILNALSTDVGQLEISLIDAEASPGIAWTYKITLEDSGGRLRQNDPTYSQWPSSESLEYKTFFMAREKEGQLQISGNSYLTSSSATTDQYHRLLYSHQFTDTEPTIDYPFFYQDDYRPYFVTPPGWQPWLENQYILFFLINADECAFIPFAEAKNRYARRSMSKSGAVLQNYRAVDPITPSTATVRGHAKAVTASARTDIVRSLSKPSASFMAPARMCETAFGGGYETDAASLDIIIVCYTFGPRFHAFSHPYAGSLISRLNEGGMDRLMEADTSLRDKEDDLFDSANGIAGPYPRINVDFGSLTSEGVYEYGAYSLYNWELFFHIPLFIATRLSRNGKYAEAMKWFHYIFDPTTDEPPSYEHPNARYWKVPPFRSSPVKSVEDFFRSLRPGVDDPLIKKWRENPFKPHVIARGRPLAYMKHVVIRYVENLISWGDDLFRRDTIESINEATQIYVIAAHVLGPRPQFVPQRGTVKPETYQSLRPSLDAFSNALVQLENIFPYSSAIPEPGATFNGSLLGIGQALYFCIPHNEQLLSHWDTVADRLFKIRHCMNIEGVERKLALFEPPIEPGLLVEAAARGVSIADVLNELNSPAPFYRFNYLVQKAHELCGEVKSLGACLLSATEKRDAEEMSRLRAMHEMNLLQVIRAVKEAQVNEAEVNKQSLEKSRETAERRLLYYRGLLGIADSAIPQSPEATDPITAATVTDVMINEIAPAVDVRLVDSEEAGVKLIGKEKEDLDKSRVALLAQTQATIMETLAGAMHLIPNIALDVQPFGIGIDTTFGGEQLGGALSTFARIPQIMSAIASYEAGKASKMASFIRREQEWTHQANMAAREIIQIDKQIISAKIRIWIAQKELENHIKQIEHAREIDLFLRGETVQGNAKKFTTSELYQWMKEQLYAVYRQSYQLAFDTAKRAEKAYRFELGEPDAGFIQYGYWDSAKEGLLAGEKLHLAVRQMEKSYLDQNKREYEITKHISLALLDPLALVKLRETGKCFFSLPEEIFDLDYPGHYFRRIKSVSITLPCVTGPFTTTSCTLRLLKNSIRINTSNGDNGYPHNADDQGLAAEDLRFVENNIPFKSIAASNAQSDSGVFELNFRDERYLPFEGAGAISGWSLELFSDDPSNNPDPANPDFGKPLRQFDYSTISDAILHVKYTSKEDAGLFKNGAIAHLRDYFGRDGTTHSVRLLSLRQEFPTQWHRFLHPINPANGNVFELEMSSSLFPFRDSQRILKVNTIWLLARCPNAESYEVDMFPALPQPSPAVDPIRMTLAPVSLYGGLHLGETDVSAFIIEIVPEALPAKWQLKMTHSGEENLQVEDLLLVLGYNWEES